MITLAALLALASTTPAFAEKPYERRNAVVLIAESDFSVGFVRHEVLLTTVIERFFTLRSERRGQSAGYMRIETGKSPLQTAMDAPASELTPEVLADVDVLVLPNWRVTTLGSPAGARQVSNNLSQTEMATLTHWVRSGGSLLVIARAVGRTDENNLPTLLAGFGLGFDYGSGRSNETPVPARGRIGQSDYALLLPTWTWSVTGGEPIATAGDRTVGSVAKNAQGQVAYLGNGQVFERGSVLSRPPFAGFDLGENIIFLVELINLLAGQPLLSTAERQHLGWDVKLMALSATMAQTDVMNYRPRSPEGSDFADAKKLLASADRGERCDLGPGCVPFTIDQAARSDLEHAIKFTDAALAALDQAEEDLGQRDYSGVERAYEESTKQAENALASVGRVRDRYDPIGRSQYNRLPIDLTLLGSTLGGCVVIGALVVGGRRLIRRRRTGD
ncbi:MAG: hypothetical protein HYY30_11585 [Chloroflexi bacterium]|nr:hypothetical protein [Chloroflexota bacterium]